jgi:hypothetical protein
MKVDVSETGWKGVVSIHLTQNRDKWRALLNTVMDILCNKTN